MSGRDQPRTIQHVQHHQALRAKRLRCMLQPSRAAEDRRVFAAIYESRDSRYLTRPPCSAAAVSRSRIEA